MVVIFLGIDSVSRIVKVGLRVNIWFPQCLKPLPVSIYFTLLVPKNTNYVSRCHLQRRKNDLLSHLIYAVAKNMVFFYIKHSSVPYISLMYSLFT